MTQPFETVALGSDEFLPISSEISGGNEDEERRSWCERFGSRGRKGKDTEIPENFPFLGSQKTPSFSLETTAVPKPCPYTS